MQATSNAARRDASVVKVVTLFRPEPLARWTCVDRVRYHGGGLDGVRGLCPHESERTPEDDLHLAAIHDQIEHPMFDEKLTALEPPRAASGGLFAR